MDESETADWKHLQMLRDMLTTENVDDVDRIQRTALHFVALKGHYECAKLCVKLGANVNARDDIGVCPLHFASSYEHVKVAHVLLDAGATVDVTDKEGCTPLYHAIANSSIDVARLLIDRGGKVSNVKLDAKVHSIPDWVTKYIASRSRCRSVVIIIIGIHKYHRTCVNTGNNDINVLRLVGKHIWSTRMDDAWSQSQ
jgi:ankyrin repeat protein